MPPKSRAAKSKVTKEAEPVVSTVRTRRTRNDTADEDNETIKSKSNAKKQIKEDKLPVKSTRASRNKTSDSETVETGKTTRATSSPVRGNLSKEQMASASDVEDDKQLTSQKRGRKRKNETDSTTVQSSSKSTRSKVVPEVVETKTRGKKSSNQDEVTESENRTLRNRTRTSSKEEKVEKTQPVKTTRGRRGKAMSETDDEQIAGDAAVEEDKSEETVPVKKTQARGRGRGRKKEAEREQPASEEEITKSTRGKRTKAASAAETTEKTTQPTRSLRTRQRTASTDEEPSQETRTSRQTAKTATVKKATKRGRADLEDSESEETKPTSRKSATATTPKLAKKSAKSETVESKPKATRTSSRQTRSHKEVDDDQSQPILELKRLSTVPEEADAAVEGETAIKSRKMAKIEEEEETEETDISKAIPPVVLDVIESIKEKIESSFKTESGEQEGLIDEEEKTNQDNKVPEEDNRNEEDNATSEVSMDVNVDLNSERGTIGESTKLEEEIDAKSSEQIEDEEVDVEKTIGFQEKSINESNDITLADEAFESEEKDANITKESMDTTIDNTMNIYETSQRPHSPLKRKSEDVEEDGDKLISDNYSKRPRLELLEPPSLPDAGGRLMTFGEDISGELGLKVTGIVRRSPVPVEGIKGRVVFLAAGGLHTVCVNSEGHVYTFGCNDAGALGRITTTDEEDETSTETQPVKVPLPAKTVKVSAGDSHSAALSSLGTVYYWGDFKDSNGFIRLTPTSTDHEFQPIAIDLNNVKFVDIASGGDHLLLLSEKGDVYSFGVAEQGQLGRLPLEEVKFSKTKKDVFLKPHLIKFPEENVVCDRIWAGNFSSFARTTDGTIYGWGLNNYSQLGFKYAKGQGDKFSPFPVKIQDLTDLGTIEEICIGQHHALALDSRRRVYSFGRYEYGRLGHGKTGCDEEKPRLIESLKGESIINIATGTVSSFAVSEKGHLYSWGMEAAQLGVSGEDLFEPTQVNSSILEKSKVLRVAAGSQHTAIIVNSLDADHNGN